MKTRNKLLTLLILSSSAAATIAAINKCIQLSATSKKLLTEESPLCYKWRLGNIYYTKSGSGKPLLLIHNIYSASSGYEWNRLIPLLEKNYTVYTIDLLGCGRSEKVNMTYTNYLYVQLISDFIKSVIGHRTSVVASGESGAIAVMACANNSELIDQIMLVNPLSLLDYSQIPGKTAKMYKFLVDLPILGTLVYNIANSRRSIQKYFAENGFYNPYNMKSIDIDTCYESAHLGRCAKSIYSSYRCNYTKCNIVNALKKIDNSIFLVGGSGIDYMKERLEEYKTYNSAIESILIPNTKYLPQMEAPEQLSKLINTYFG